MNLQELDAELRVAKYVGINREYVPPTPPAEGERPWGYDLYYRPDEGFTLELQVWSGYHHTLGNRFEPGVDDWADEDYISFTSPYLSECLEVLIEHNITLPTGPVDPYRRELAAMYPP